MYTFKKEERLCSEKLIQQLFNNGSSFILYPFRISWLIADFELGAPAQVVISAPKRNFKRAVDRNILKRRIREAYRLNKNELLYQQLEQHGTRMLLSVHFVGKEIFDYPFIEKKLRAALVKLISISHEKALD